MENNSKREEALAKAIHKSVHLELPEYVLIPVDETFMSPETVTNISKETLDARYATMDEINTNFYEKIKTEQDL